jgi:hypothetical protein
MSGDWEELTKEQQEALDAFRKSIGDVLSINTEAFEKAHPDLRLTYSFTSDALIREKHPIVYHAL